MHVALFEFYFSVESESISAVVLTACVSAAIIIFMVTVIVVVLLLILLRREMQSRKKEAISVVNSLSTFRQNSLIVATEHQCPQTGVVLMQPVPHEGLP